MRPYYLGLAAILAAMALASPSRADGGNTNNYSFAIKEFKTADSLVYPGWYAGWNDGLNNAVCDMLTTELSDRKWSIVERSRLKDILGEQDLGASGRVSASSAPKIGKLKGAVFLLVGTITEWGIKETSAGAAGKMLGGIFGGIGRSAQYNETDARVKIDYRVVNSETGEVLQGSAGTAQGDQKDRSIQFHSDWYSGINFGSNDWTSSQIGKATRQAVKQMADQLDKWKQTSDWTATVRVDVHASIVAVSSPREVVIDSGSDQGVHTGDTLDIFSVTDVKNSSGKVVFQKKVKVGQGVITDVQASGAVLKVTTLDAGVKLREGDLISTPGT